MGKIVLGMVALLALSGVSLFIGVIDLRPTALLQDPAALQLIAVSRAPRLFAVLITGASLAVAGTVLQMLVRNRFVEPMTVGSGEGAALGILLVTLYAPAASLLAKIAMASATAFASTAGFLAIARRLPPTQPYMVALVGLVYGGVIGAGVTFVAYQNDLLQMIGVWVTGEFSGVLRGRYETLWLAALAAVLCFVAADQFSILGLGHAASINLGLNYRQVMLFGLLAVSLVSALTVVSVGIIPFVGLIVPNIVSRMMGDNLRRTLPVIAMMGAGLVLVADIVARVLRYPFEMPSATVLGVVGAIVFIWLLYRPARHAP